MEVVQFVPTHRQTHSVFSVIRGRKSHTILTYVTILSAGISDLGIKSIQSLPLIVLIPWASRPSSLFSAVVQTTVSGIFKSMSIDSCQPWRLKIWSNWCSFIAHSKKIFCASFVCWLKYKLCVMWCSLFNRVVLVSVDWSEALIFSNSLIIINGSAVGPVVIPQLIK